MWAYESVFYQIYPLGLLGAPLENDGKQVSRILELRKWIPHIKKLGADAVYLCPVFESDSHGYDTRDFSRIDCRLGSNEDFRVICGEFHHAGIRVVLDGVFHHVGRGFYAFQDVLKNRENSPYLSWFFVDLGGDSPYGDGLWYEGWEGHYNLVKLNLKNPQVTEYLLNNVRSWISEFDIDGLRLDVAYSLEPDFLRALRNCCNSAKEDFFLVGEMLHGDYNRLVNEEMLHSCTNYECYKGLYSSFNSWNLFEINHSLLRQFGPEAWSLYKGKHLLCFADNHDVTRVATILQQKEHLPLLYTILFTMPGIPCIYYGSEWGLEGDKAQGDQALRPALSEPVWNELTEMIKRLAEIKRASDALNYGSFRSVLLTNRQCIYERKTQKECIWVAVNADGAPFQAHFAPPAGKVRELLSDREADFTGEWLLPPYSAAIWHILA